MKIIMLHACSVREEAVIRDINRELDKWHEKNKGAEIVSVSQEITIVPGTACPDIFLTLVIVYKPVPPK
ncbi:MAG: hypothetical protein Q7S81_00405 [bacterium]|nr:hypothetical protein [bacterium]